MSLKHGILGLLSYGSLTGYELMKIFNDSLSFFWSAQTSQIYRELDTIEKKGWVESEEVIQHDKPNKKVFTITRDGQYELTSWLDNHAIEKHMKYKDDLTMRVFFSSKGDQSKLIEELKKYEAMNQAFINGIEVVKVKYVDDNLEDHPSDILYWHMAIRRGIRTAEGNIRWVQDCIELLDREGEN